jgi:hypothetical protein
MAPPAPGNPKRLRLFSTAGRMVRVGYGCLSVTWPWASHPTTAITRLEALPASARPAALSASGTPLDRGASQP